LGRKESNSASKSEEDSVDKMRENMQFNSWLSRRGHILRVLEESIEQARNESQAKVGRGRDNASRLEWSRTLIRLLELYDEQLEAVKRHLYGSSMPGAGTEPGQMKDGLINFERQFLATVQMPLTLDSLKGICQDCGTTSILVKGYYLPIKSKDGSKHNEDVDLCPKCYEKRKQSESS
jgi:hypothetical protein